MDCDNDEAKNNTMILSGYILVKKSKKSQHLISEWLKYAMDERNLTDCENQCGFPNSKGFHEHRHDHFI